MIYANVDTAAAVEISNHGHIARLAELNDLIVGVQFVIVGRQVGCAQ